MSAKQPIPAPDRPVDATRPVSPQPPNPRGTLWGENARLRDSVAELVALLRMGKELAEAARDSTQGTPQKRYRAANEANAILDRYDDAIAKHGGGQ